MFHNIIMNKFSERLKELRVAKNLSRKQIAELIGVHDRSVAYWETGQRQCDFDMLIKLAELLDTSVDYLIGATDF